VLEELQQKVAALEREPKGLRYCGVWQRAATYERHEGVTHRDCTWVCVADESRGIEPGTAASDWQLIAKGAR
jgi:hypothetical protein